MNYQELSRLADEYILGMTSIRGRRIKKLIIREYSDSDSVTIEVKNGKKTIVSETRNEKRICSTDGKGKYVDIMIQDPNGISMIRRFDLLHDSLKLISETRNKEIGGQEGNGISNKRDA